MPPSESFDAFYARTSWNVTSHLHALAAGDPLVDHAIREAYAKAYQQWYEVSSYPDSEAWVLGVARDAYQRRLAEAQALGALGPAVGRVSAAGDAGPGWGQADGGSATATADELAQPTVWAGHSARGEPAGVAGAGLARVGLAAVAWLRRRWREWPARARVPAPLGSRRNLTVLAAALAVVLAAGIVYALSSAKPGQSAAQAATGSGQRNTAAGMLTAGQTGDRAAIPWSLVGPGWTLAEVSTAPPGASGSAPAGSDVTYLVDPDGGRYQIRTMSGHGGLSLLAWSGNAKNALYAVGGRHGGTPSYELLTLASGALTPLPLPGGVTALGFTRPDGLNVIAIQQRDSRYRLERYNLAGAYQATIASLPRPGGATDVLRGNALSSPDGTTAVWSVSGSGMQLVSNAGGLIRRLRVPGAGSSSSCTPLSWWSPDTVLAYCGAIGQSDAGLWLVPAAGGQPTQLTSISAAPGGLGDLTGAWQAAGAVYVTSATSARCEGAQGGPSGQQILKLGRGGAHTPVRIPATTQHRASIIAGVGRRLLILAQTACPGPSSLLWFNPSTGAAQVLLAAPATEAGVVAAVPYGSGPTATAG